MNTHFDPAPGGDALSTFRWRDFWVLSLRRIGLFFACFGAVLLVTIIYLIKAPRVYESTGDVQVEERTEEAFKTPDSNTPEQDLKSDDALKTIEQNLQTYSLFLDVARDPAIASDPNLLVGYPSADRPVDLDSLAKWLKSNTAVSLRHGTRLIDVSVFHQAPEMAQKLVQSLINAFIAENAQVQASTQKSVIKYLVAQSAQVKDSLQKSENSLQVYKDALLLKDRIEDQQRVIDALSQRYRAKHPQMIQAHTLMADLMQTFDREFQKVVAGSNVESTYWAANRQTIASAAPADRVSLELKLVEARSNVLEMEVDTESALFDNVLKQMREANVNRDATPIQIRLVEPPDLPVRPAKPRKTFILLAGMILGGLLGGAAVFVANAIDSSIKTVTEAEEVLGLPSLGAIPLFSREKTPGKTPPASRQDKPENDDELPGELVVRTDPGSGAAEGFRSLRASISLLGKSQDHRSLLFTSALPAEGKTFIASNYSVALAQAGLKTLLIDVDLRVPSIHRCFNLENRQGFVEVVTKGLNLYEVVHRDVAENLDILTSGSRCPNPAELLSGSGFVEVLAMALKTYDRITIDCSPINLVSDSLLIASAVQSVCLVVRAGRTRRLDAEHAISLLKRAQIKPSGFVFNAIPPWGDRLYPTYLGQKSSKYRQSYVQAGYRG
jgi:succinoglycan biosynthesis transport protein ExoP